MLSQYWKEKWGGLCRRPPFWNALLIGSQDFLDGYLNRLFLRKLLAVPAFGSQHKRSTAELASVISSNSPELHLFRIDGLRSHCPLCRQQVSGFTSIALPVLQTNIRRLFTAFSESVFLALDVLFHMALNISKTKESSPLTSRRQLRGKQRNSITSRGWKWPTFFLIGFTELWGNAKARMKT